MDETVKFCRQDGTPLLSDLPDGTEQTVILPSENRNDDMLTQPIQNSPSIAVLPFVNVSTEPENDYFCDELSGELIIKLAKLNNLKVAARTSAFSFKGKNVHISEIGQFLGVDSVLEGQVLKIGSRLRINVVLDSVSHGNCLWSEQYDRQMEDIFDVLDEITMAIVEALKMKLLGKEITAALKRYTGDSEAYLLYLKGRHFFYKHTGEGWLKAIEYFEKAIDIEPKYAPAYAGLSSVLAFAWYFGALHPDEAIPKWKAANSRALEIGGDLQETHIALGRFQFLYKWNWEEAEREYKRSIKLNPSNADAHQQYGLFLTVRQRFEEAINEARWAVELDPLSLVVNLHVGWMYWLTDRWDETLGQIQKMIEIEPNFYPAYQLMGGVYVMEGKYEEAIESYQKSLALGGSHLVLSGLGHAYGLSGKRDEALGVINQLLEAMKYHYVTAFNIALVYGGLRENDKAFEWLEQAYQQRNGELVYLKLHADMGTVGLWGKSFRADPRFPDLLERIGLTS